MDDTMNRPCIVVGASGDLGAAVARRLLRENRRMVLTSTQLANPKVVQVLQDKASSDRVMWSQMDVRDTASVNAGIESARSFLGPSYDLVYCTGIVRDAPIALASDESWESTFQTNLRGAFFVLRAAARDLMVAGSARVVLVSSVSGQLANPGQAAYAASKAGLDALARVAASEFGRFGVCVNTIALGAMEGSLIRSANYKLPARVAEVAPLRRLASSDECAEAVAALLGPAGSYITAQAIVVDGGLSAV